MDIFVIFIMTIGGAGFVVGLGACYQIGKLHKKVSSLRRDLEELREKKADK